MRRVLRSHEYAIDRDRIRVIKIADKPQDKCTALYGSGSFTCSITDLRLDYCFFFFFRRFFNFNVQLLFADSFPARRNSVPATIVRWMVMFAASVLSVRKLLSFISLYGFFYLFFF